jgi:NAD(P)-dependent dehydrogenase (short-subunit alcohol dehydrogenase family)
MAERAPRHVLVTGGGAGIGAAIARRFAESSDRVAVLERSPASVAALRADAAIELTIAGDVSDPEAVAAAFEDIDREWGRIDIVVNNAGISIRDPFLDVTLADWNAVLATNLTAVFLVCQQASRRMVRQHEGVIINIGSVSGMVGMPNYAGYNVSKAGVIELTKTLALELAPSVRVNAICPGYVLTPMQASEYRADMLAECARKVPAGRLGRPEEVAALAVYLASHDAAFATGQAFVLDGGETAGGLASR